MLNFKPQKVLIKNNKLAKIYIALFVVVFIFLYSFQTPQVLPDPDSFYHARIAVMIGEQGIIQDFPFLQFTTLNSGFIDQHFLYHVLLIPFVKIFDPLLGVKIAQTVITSFFIVVFYWFLKQEKIKWPFLWVTVLIINAPLIFRLLLIKTNSLSLIFLVFGCYFLFNQKYKYLFVLCYLYVLTYGGWPLILLFTFFYVLSRIIKKQKSFKQINVSYQNYKLIFASIGGLLMGLIINPYFPKNLYFYYQQIIQIGLFGSPDEINIGSEWGDYSLQDLFLSNGVVFIFFFLAIFLFFATYKNQNSKSVAFLLLSTVVLYMTTESRRYVEYLIPILILFSAFSFNYFLRDNLGKEVESIMINFYKRYKLAYFFLGSIFIWMLIFISINDIGILKKDLSSGSSFDYYKGAGNYLKENSNPGDVVFHSDWDDFPPLFYHSPQNYYIVGLDPTFMYNFDKNLYQEYEAITLGKDKQNLYDKLKNDFKANFVFLDTKHLLFNDNLIADGGFELVYKDSEALIFKIK